MKIRNIAVSGIIAALYIAVTALVAPFAFGVVQFRLSEMFNHLIVFNKKYFYGIVLGVFFANLFFSPAALLDIIFGVGHTAVSLLLVIWLTKHVKNVWLKMLINSFIFSFMIFIVAIELLMISEVPISFWETWLFLALGEVFTMGITMPLMYAVDRGVHFHKLIEPGK